MSHGGVYFVVLNVIATETLSFSVLEGGGHAFSDKKVSMAITLMIYVNSVRMFCNRIGSKTVLEKHKQFQYENRA